MYRAISYEKSLCKCSVDVLIGTQRERGARTPLRLNPPWNLDRDASLIAFSHVCYSLMSPKNRMLSWILCISALLGNKVLIQTSSPNSFGIAFEPLQQL